MTLRRHFAASMALAVAASTGHAWAATIGDDVLTTPHFVIAYRDIDKSLAKRVGLDAEAAYGAVTSYLGKEPTETIRIEISNEHLFPRHDKKTRQVFIPANRVRGDAAGPRGLRGRGTAIVSQITPIIAPSANKLWGSFLETGLRVYLQTKFEAQHDRSFPTMGRDLHEETVRLATAYGRFIPLMEVEKARTWRNRLTRTRRLAYLEEGSFVRFLIENFGLPKFMMWYDGGEFDRSYGQPFALVERQWKTQIGANRP